jgi:hypothetical protein
MTEEETLAAPAFKAYMGAKTLAEKAVWKFADEHKDVDITVCTCFHLSSLVPLFDSFSTFISESSLHLWPLCSQLPHPQT